MGPIARGLDDQRALSVHDAIGKRRDEPMINLG
jgi:hypothetical protein